MEIKIKLDNNYIDPFGVPFHTILNSLNDPSKEIIQNKTQAIIKSKKTETLIDISKPEFINKDNRVISSVLIIKTKLPSYFDKLIANYDAIRTLNQFASLGAITLIDNEYYLGTRLTIFEGDDLWKLHIPLITMTVLCAEDSIIGALEKIGSGKSAPTEKSFWKNKDFKIVENYLKKICVCNYEDLVFTAEFPLSENAISVGISEKINTALLTLKANENHLELGGGLFSLLNMPHSFENQEELFYIIKKFNQIEMQGIDLAPHYGAWTSGNEKTLSYVSFLPNIIYNLKGAEDIAVNMSYWASERAQAANKILSAEGIYF